MHRRLRQQKEADLADLAPGADSGGGGLGEVEREKGRRSVLELFIELEFLVLRPCLPVASTKRKILLARSNRF